MESKIRHGYDANLVLRAPGAVALVATATSTKIVLDRISHSARGALDGRFGYYDFSAVVHFGAGFAPGTDNTYTLTFQSFDAAGANGVVHHTRVVLAADVGKTEVFTFDTGSLLVENANAFQFGAVLTIVGTTPSATYWAFLAPAD